jgi:hypothetical protein
MVELAVPTNQFHAINHGKQLLLLPSYAKSASPHPSLADQLKENHNLTFDPIGL